MARTEIRVAAVEIQQSPGRAFYLFGIDGKVVHSFATVSRLRRSGGGDQHGYQRPEALAHIAEIRDYIESSSPMIPNAVVIAFDDRVRFEPILPFVASPSYSRVGTLVIPVEHGIDDEDKPGFIVDGQQRLAAVREAEIDVFPLAVTAFIAKDVKQQVEQFILINSTKPLQKALIYELLPNTDAKLPTPLERRRIPAHIVDRLNRDEDSPFRYRIQTPTNPVLKNTFNATVKDNSVLRMVENSLSDGCLYRFRGDITDQSRLAQTLAVLKNFWWAVANVFPVAWNETPRRSRLVHGVGIVSLGFIMDVATARRTDVVVPTIEDYEEDLRLLADACRWTEGSWDFGRGTLRKWNELQNTSKDIQLLANHLRTEYRTLVWDGKKTRG